MAAMVSIISAEVVDAGRGCFRSRKVRFEMLGSWMWTFGGIK